MFSLQVTYKGPDRERRINLWYHDNHFDVIKNMKGLYGSNHYCNNCDKPFSRIEDHCCTDFCFICLDRTCIPGEALRCSDCDRLCRSVECYGRHKATPGNQELSICDRVSFYFIFV